MSDETIGVPTDGNTPETEDSPTRAFPDAGTNGNETPVAAAPGEGASGAADQTTASTEDSVPGQPEMEQMPPLDQIDVPGGESGGGRNRRGDREGRESELAAGRVVTGTVVHIDSEGVLVDVGLKTEGLIRPNELSREPVANIEDIVQKGDKIDVLIMDPEGRDGNPLLSKKRADFEKAWDRVQEALEDGRVLQAMVTDRVKGGLVVDLGIRGFVPASHVGNGKLKNLEKFVGQTVPLKVLEVDREHRKVVLSHRLATEEERQKQKEETISSLEEGQIRTGIVRRVADYGAFVDLGGIDGLLHVSEMSWTRVNHPSDVVKVGDQIQVMILKLNLDQGRVSLGLRQILPDPWSLVAEKYHVGDVVEGEVTRLVPFGAFVLLEGDIEGIIPNSELAHRRINKPGDVVEQGQQVQVKVIDVRPEERRLTLSLRALQPREPQEDYRAGRAPGAAPPPPQEEGGRPEAPRRGGRGGRRGRDEEEGGDYRQFMTSREEPRLTIGDMFGDMLTGGGRGGRGGGGGGPRERRRGRQEEEEEDLSDIELEDPTVDEAENVDAEASSDDPDTEKA